MTVLGPDQVGPRLAAACRLAEDAARRVTDVAISPRARFKGWANWVTATDVEIEDHVRGVLAKQFPEDAIVGEELVNLFPGTDRPIWYVDPIDGTTNFVHGLRSCSFSLAVADAAGIALGVVADPWRHEFFVAARGQGARANGVPLRCRDDVSLEGSLVLTELEGPGPWPGMTGLIEDLGRGGCVTRILGSCALSLANVGAGRAAGLVLGGAHPIDVAAGVLIAREAGAVVQVGAKADRALGPDKLGTSAALVASAPGVLTQLLESLSRSAPSASYWMAPGQR